MQMVSILVRNYQQSSEGFGILDMHLSRGMKHRESADAGHKCTSQHAHAQQRGDFDGGHHSSQTHVDPNACSVQNTLQVGTVTLQQTTTTQILLLIFPGRELKSKCMCEYA